MLSWLVKRFAAATGALTLVVVGFVGASSASAADVDLTDNWALAAGKVTIEEATEATQAGVDDDIDTEPALVEVEQTCTSIKVVVVSRSDQTVTYTVAVSGEEQQADMRAADGYSRFGFPDMEPGDYIITVTADDGTDFRSTITLAEDCDTANPIGIPLGVPTCDELDAMEPGDQLSLDDEFADFATVTLIVNEDGSRVLNADPVKGEAEFIATPRRWTYLGDREFTLDVDDLCDSVVDPSPGPTDEPTEQPSEESSPTPTETESSTPEPTETSSEEPSSTPSPTATATLSSSPNPSEASSEKPAPGSTEDASDEPTDESSQGSTSTSTPSSTAKATASPPPTAKATSSSTEAPSGGSTTGSTKPSSEDASLVEILLDTPTCDNVDGRHYGDRVPIPGHDGSLADILILGENDDNARLDAQVFEKGGVFIVPKGSPWEVAEEGRWYILPVAELGCEIGVLDVEAIDGGTSAGDKDSDDGTGSTGDTELSEPVTKNKVTPLADFIANSFDASPTPKGQPVTAGATGDQDPDDDGLPQTGVNMKAVALWSLVGLVCAGGIVVHLVRRRHHSTHMS